MHDDRLQQPETIRKQPIWVDTPNSLSACIDEMAKHPLLAVDTESDSLYSYFEKVCLIQFSTESTDYLIDPLAVDVTPLGQLFVDPAIEKIFHAAEYDIYSLKRDYAFEFNNLFDTMIAAKILGYKRYGLGALLEQHFDVKLDKRFQRYNWGQRPIDDDALDYARLDTLYLIPLRNMLMRELDQNRRLREALEAFERQNHIEPTERSFDPNGFWRVKGCRDLPPREQAVVRSLFMLRDKIARRLDKPPFKIMNDKTLVELAQVQPTSIGNLKNIRGVGGNLIRYNGHDLLQAIMQGKRDPTPRYQHNNAHRPDDDTLQRYEKLRKWRNSLAKARGVEPDVIMGNSTLMQIARHNPLSITALYDLDELGPWQIETYGQGVINLLTET